MKKTMFVIFCLLTGGIARPALAQPQTITIPAGTEIAIRTTTALNSKTANKSTEYPVSMDDPITVNGTVVVPANTNAWLRVTDAKNPKLGRASMSFTLVAVSGAAGERVDVTTGTVDSKDGAHAKRTLVGAGVGAGTGAAIGSVAGPLGAGIGAGIGAVTGGTLGKLTGNSEGLTIPAETRYTYRLAQPVTINYQSQPYQGQPPVQTQIDQPLQPVSPVTPAPQGNVNIQVGQTRDQVVGMLGQPDRKLVVGAKEIYFYNQMKMKITFQDGAVSDAE